MRPLISLGIFFLMAYGLLTHPDVFSTVIHVIVFSVFGFMGFIFLLVALGVWFPEWAKTMGITVKKSEPLGFVGSEGKGSSLRVTTPEVGSIRVEWARRDYLFTIFVFTVFGPGLLALYLKQPAKWLLLPPMLKIVVGGLMVLLSLYFLDLVYVYFRKRPALSIDGSSITFLRGHDVIKTLSQDQLATLRIENHSFRSLNQSASREWPNFILTTDLKDGTRERLCISDQKSQIEDLAAAIGSRMGVSLRASATSPSDVGPS